MKARGLILLFVAIAAVFLAGAIAWRTTRGHEAEQAVAIGGPFQLTDQNGRVVDESVLKGKWSAVFFGFTYCPDVCPATLQTLNAAAERLGPKAKDFQVVFVSVDPKRDTPEQLKAYLEAQNLRPGTVALTGTQPQIVSVTKAYRAYFAREGEGDDYTVTHTNVVYLMNPRGRFDRPLRFDTTPGQIADQIREAMS